MQKTDPLIRTKLRLPFTRPDLVARSRLQEQITQGLLGPLTLITAPAGFGKTTLVASCVAGCGMPVAWLSLDKDDNQSGRFLRYLLASLQMAAGAIGSEAAQLLAASPPAPPEAVLTSLINDLDSANTEMALVLDDYHLISSQAVHEDVAFLLEHRPSAFHLVVATRSDPPLPLARLRARGQTVELRAADLRFTEPEAARFLNEVMGLRLDAKSVAVLEERTEGWIAGLQMAALSMRDRKDVFGFIEGFSGTNRYILDYLLEEVLASQSPEIQHFLLCTSILKRLTAPLCDAVLEADEGSTGTEEDRPAGSESLFLRPSASILGDLEKANLFLVPLDDDRRWYRYHHLFADLLQARLHQSSADRAARLLSRAAEWCEQDGQIDEAVSYALAAQDDRRAVGLVEKYWPLAVANGEIETVFSWLDALPEDEVRNNAPLCIAFCWVLWLTGQVSAIEPHLVNAENALRERVVAEGSVLDDPPYAGLPTQFAVLRSIIARYRNDLETSVALAERALTLMPANLPPQEDAQLRALIFLALGSAYDGAGDLEKAAGAYSENIHWSRFGASATGVAGMTYRLIGILRMLGRLRAADAACRDALDYIQVQGMSRVPAAGILHVAMSEVLVERNELEAAEAHLSQGMELGKWSGRMDAVKNAAYVLSRLRQARHDPNGALAAVQEAESAMAELRVPLASAGLLALRARILVRQGALSEAARCIEEAISLAGEDQGQTREDVDLAASRVLLAQCQPAEAVARLGQSLASAEERGRMGAAIELRILRSLVLARQGEPREAAADLEQALALAEREGYVRVFLEEGRPMQMLIAQWLAHAGPGLLRNYAILLLSHFGAEPLDGERPQAEGQTVTTAQAMTSPAGNLVEPEHRPAKPMLVEALSQRELEVLHLIALGRTNQEIARQLIVSPGTVKAHTANIYRKLDVANRTEAVARARQLGILP